MRKSSLGGSEGLNGNQRHSAGDAPAARHRGQRRLSCLWRSKSQRPVARAPHDGKVGLVGPEGKRAGKVDYRLSVARLACLRRSRSASLVALLSAASCLLSCILTDLATLRSILPSNLVFLALSRRARATALRASDNDQQLVPYSVRRLI